MESITPVCYPYRNGDVLLSIKDLNIGFGSKPIIYDFNLEVCDIIREGCTQGQVIALLGPSGIGKTQLFRRIAGLDAPTSGQVRVGTKQLPVNPGDVGVVFQNYPLFEEETVESNLAIAAHEAGLASDIIKQGIPQYLEAFDLMDRAKAYPYQLSGGQRQRASIIQQLLRSSNRTDGFLLLMDEPVSGLDPVQVLKVCKIITQVTNANDKNTTIVVTHDVSSAVCIADRLVLVGRRRDTEGKLIPGATKIEEIDLVAMGLAWHPDIMSMPEFHEVVRVIKTEKFPAL